MKTLFRTLMIAFMTIMIPSMTTGCASIKEGAVGLYHSTKDGAVNLYHSTADAFRGEKSGDDQSADEPKNTTRRGGSDNTDRCKKLSGSLYRGGGNPAEASERMRKAGCS
ncbi:hypothetical protein KC902_01785 [Candidatus Kaiserbacteria bacterium]|nr:hypothetical protein [Candidatus Kaiserbacteria bacterium]USN89076.1 MAG: hypothetical protein H6780_01475 [Candidatus Nomurabacteria bacterium]